MNRYSSPLSSSSSSSSSSTMTVTLQSKQPSSGSLHPLILSPMPLRTPSTPPSSSSSFSLPNPQPSPRSPSSLPRMASGPSSDSLPSSSITPSPLFTPSPSKGLLETSPSKSSSLVMPQPRKPIATSQILPSLSATLFSAKDSLEGQHEEALSELLEIIRSSSQSGLMRSQTPRAYYSPKDDQEEDDEEMDIPTLSSSPLSESGSGGFPSSLQMRSPDFFDPPFRAQNPLAFSCQCTPLSQGAELDLLRPSPPPFLDASSSSSRFSAWD